MIARSLWPSVIAAVSAAAAWGPASVASAQTTAPAAPPRLFAGYAQPAIPASACHAVDAGETDCRLPGMIVGRYVVEAAGTSTAQGAGAVHTLQIFVGEQSCGAGRSTEPWSSGARTLRLDCAFTVLSDQPIPVRVVYGGDKAAKDPKGPAVDVRPLAWNGVLSSVVFAPKQ